LAKYEKSIDTSKFTKDDLIAFLVCVLEQYIDYKQFIGQSIDNLHNVDMAIVPLQKKDFDFLGWEKIDKIFNSMNFREPRQGESYWRVPGFITIPEANIFIEKLRGLSMIESTVPVDQDIPETMPIEPTVPATAPVDEDEEYYPTAPVDQDDEGENNYATNPATMPIDEDQIQATVPIDEDQIQQTVPIDDEYDEIPSRMQTQNTDMELDPMGLLGGKNTYADDDNEEIEYE